MFLDWWVALLHQGTQGLRQMVAVLGQIMPIAPPTTKDVHILIPETCVYVTLYDKRNFAGMIKLMILRWQYLDLSRCT